MTFGSIYKIVFPNGKKYIGLTTTSIEQRTKEHKSAAKKGDPKCLYKAIRKYELVETLELVEIDTADTIEELCEKEIRYIIEYKSYYMNGGCGYNMTLGGEGTNGYVYTEEDKQKMSESQKKRFENPEEIKKNRETQKKRFENNPEARQKNSEAQKKRFENNPEAGKEHGERLKKHYKDNPKARQQMSEIKKKHFEDNPEAGKEHSERMKKHFEDNPEAGKKNSEAQKKRFKDNPEARQKCSEAQKKRFENPEEIKKNSERMKKYYENPEAIKKILDTKGQNKPFDVFTKDGTFINTFTYQFEAEKYLREKYKVTSTIYISSVLAGKQNNSAGFVFKYK